MAEKDKDEENTEGAEEAAKPAGKKKLFIIIGGLVFLVLAIGAPVAFFTLRSTGPKTEEVSSDAAEGKLATGEGYDFEDELEEGEEPIGAILPLDSFVVNLAGGAKFIRLQVQVEFNSLDIPRKLYPRLVPIRDSIITMLTQRSPEDLGSTKGKDTLRSDIKDMINETLKREEVKKIYFTQFVIQ